MAKDKSRLVLAIEIAGKLEGGNALHRIDEDADSGEQVRVGHLAGGEDGAACDGVLLLTAKATERGAALYRLAIETTTLRANGLTIRRGPTNALERLASL